MEQLRELCDGYRFEGMFYDMNFWPDVCYCGHCRERYRHEAGREIPLLVDWTEENWCTFQGKREEWLAEMGSFVSDTARRLKPGISTQHNFAQITINWEFGFTDRMLPACDYLGGDFYGSFTHAAFIARLLRRMSPQQPWEYMTSRCQPASPSTPTPSRSRSSSSAPTWRWRTAGRCCSSTPSTWTAPRTRASTP